METSLVSLGLFVQLALLAVALCIGQFLERRRIRWLGEAATALGLGVVVGLLARVAGARSQLRSILEFKGEFFLYVLLPPIMFEAGFTLDFDQFVVHLLPICLLAFLGTITSMLLVGGTMWAAGAWGWIHALSPLKAMLFGAIISATDPVTVLAVFKKLGARADLYMVVFGESVLNDAVGIVLYQTVVQFLDRGTDVDLAALLTGLGVFCGIFLASMAIGVVVGFLSYLVVATQFFQEPASSTEAGFVAVMALTSYFAAQAAGLSGIVAIMFCGITINRATKPRLGQAALHQLEAFFTMASTLAELFVFIYIGSMVFAVDQQWHVLGFTAVALFALAHSRALHVVPLSHLSNALRPKHLSPISAAQQFMLWWSGLRGGVAFALSVNAAQKYGDDGKVMETSILAISVLTVLVNGGASPYLLERLQLLQSQCADDGRQLDASGRLPKEPIWRWGAWHWKLQGQGYQKVYEMMQPREPSCSNSLADSDGGLGDGIPSCRSSQPQSPEQPEGMLPDSSDNQQTGDLHHNNTLLGNAKVTTVTAAASLGDS